MEEGITPTQAETKAWNWDTLRAKARLHRELVHMFTQSDERPRVTSDAEEEFVQQAEAYAASQGITLCEVGGRIAEDFWA